MLPHSDFLALDDELLASIQNDLDDSFFTVPEQWCGYAAVHEVCRSCPADAAVVGESVLDALVAAKTMKRAKEIPSRIAELDIAFEASKRHV